MVRALGRYSPKNRIGLRFFVLAPTDIGAQQMIVSWNWLKQYVPLNMSHDELVERLTMSGLNHEGTERVDDDRAIDLEVTSNRPDCLGHLGVAREISVLFELPLTIPEPQPATSSTKVEDLCQVSITAPELCSRFTARVIKGVKVGPSPDWLADYLEAVGFNLVNNLVDITNYVMFECGQPLHAFDFQKIKRNQIIVREAEADESFLAIDHKTYKLEPGMCVIADAERALAIGGVMGGAESEVSTDTVDILIEAATFDPLSIRRTSRQLNLMSDASYRFERPTDPERVDWASRRCCELILELAGGELASGAIDVGTQPQARDSVTLRLDQIPRILGIEVEPTAVEKILETLGLEIESHQSGKIEVTPPSWRSDLTREADLIEEVARIHGYEKIPEDAAVPMTATIRSDGERIWDQVRSFATAAGFDEAITASLTLNRWTEMFSPWSAAEPLVSAQPMLGVLDRAWQNVGQVNVARKSLIPSLLEVRRYNEHRSNQNIDVFEIARVYLPNPERLPTERWMIGISSERSFGDIKGLIESLATSLDPEINLEARTADFELLDRQACCELFVGDKRFAVVGELATAAAKTFKLARRCTIAEVDLSLLSESAKLIRTAGNISPYPSVSREFNFVVEESLQWSDLAATVKASAGELLESIEYRETFRDVKRDGPGKKRLLLSITLRSSQETLTGEQAEATCQSIVSACASSHHAQILA